MKEIIPLLVELVFTAIAVFLIPAIKRWLKEKLNEQQLKTLTIVVQNTTKAVEQIVQDLNQGALKKEQVVAFVNKYCEKNNIKIDSELLDILIESAVKEMNDLKK